MKIQDRRNYEYRLTIAAEHLDQMADDRDSCGDEAEAKQLEQTATDLRELASKIAAGWITEDDR